MAQAICGSRSEVVKGMWDKILEFLGIIGLVTLIGAIGAIREVLKVIKVIQELVVWGMPFAWAVVAVAIIVYLTSVWVLVSLWKSDCLDDQLGEERCLSGVVDKVYGEEVNAVLNPEHPHVDLVVKSRSEYWLLLAAGEHVYCSDAGSPILKIFYKSSRICAVRGGAAGGGALAGIGGIIAACIAGAAIGCATIYLCIVALVVAALIVLAAVLIGALAGGGIAAATEDPDPPNYDDGNLISVGDYISAQGTTARNDNYKGAVVQYFNNNTALLGHSLGSPSFSHMDPDTAVPDALEMCPIP